MANCQHPLMHTYERANGIRFCTACGADVAPAVITRALDPNTAHLFASKPTRWQRFMAWWRECWA